MIISLSARPKVTSSSKRFFMALPEDYFERMFNPRSEGIQASPKATKVSLPVLLQKAGLSASTEYELWTGIKNVTKALGFQQGRRLENAIKAALKRKGITELGKKYKAREILVDVMILPTEVQTVERLTTLVANWLGMKAPHGATQRFTNHIASRGNSPNVIFGNAVKNGTQLEVTRVRICSLVSNNGTFLAGTEMSEIPVGYDVYLIEDSSVVDANVIEVLENGGQLNLVAILGDTFRNVKAANTVTDPKTREYLKKQAKASFLKAVGHPSAAEAANAAAEAVRTTEAEIAEFQPSTPAATHA